MVRPARLQVVFVALWVVAVSPASAQDPGPTSPTPAPAPPVPDILKALPRVADQPGSLYQSAPPPAPAPPPLDRPYFRNDPLLDPPELSSPGWFLETEVGLVFPHVRNQLSNAVPTAVGPITVQLPSAGLGLTAAPRFEAGYRLPSGFGEVSVGYRFLVGEGTETSAEPDGLHSVRSRLDVNQFDLTYASRELSLWPHWDMKWSLGLRLAYVFFDSRGERPIDPATGLFETRLSNFYVGFGPHTGLELARRLEGMGLSLVSRVDFAALMGRIRQDYEADLASAAGGGPLAGLSSISSSQTVPTVNAQAGLRWQPPSWPAAHLFLGYQYEKWWNVGRLSKIDTKGELRDQGIFLQGGLNF